MPNLVPPVPGMAEDNGMDLVVLGSGDSGQAVRIIQNRLAALGYHQGLVDGSYGTITQRAVAAFQRANGLRATGLIDNLTLRALGYEVDDNAPAAPQPGGGFSVEAVAKLFPDAPVNNIRTYLPLVLRALAEVFAERVRQLVCVDKIPAQEWLRIHGLAHSMGMQSNATLLAGLGETPEERIDHVLAIREQQDKTGGFMTFIPLNCYYDNNAVDAANALTGVENLKNFAISRILLDNVPHIKSFWIHIGEKLSQVSLSFGVDDIDGTVVQEKIAHAAGTDTSQALTQAELVNMIRKAGKIPVERDTVYNIIRVYDEQPV
jgi:hypothetical protein